MQYIMNWLQKLRQRAYSYFLKRGMQKRPDKQEPLNFRKAKTVGIIFEAKDGDNVDAFISTYKESLLRLGKRVEVLAHFNDREQREFYPFPSFSNRDKNWAKVPNSKEVKYFIEKPFDVLLCLHSQPNSALEYIAAVSKANFRVGFYQSSTVGYYELMVHNKDNSIRSLLNQIEPYLKIINQPNEKVA